MPKVTQAQVLASICRESFEQFCRNFWSTIVPDQLLWNWHLSVMCEELQVGAERVFANKPREYDLVTNVSTGCGKSMVHSILYPAWIWTRMPHAKIIGASYTHNLALDLASKCRDVIKSELYQACFPEIQIRTDQDAKEKFENTKTGMRYSVGARGSVQGMHGHFIIIDDPIDPNSVVSPTELFVTNEWMKNTLSGRKKDKEVSFTALVMQRLHQDDPTANKVKEDRIRWIRLPATDEFKILPPELKNNYVDGLMHPRRMSRAFLNEERKRGEWFYAGQFGQDPIPIGGGKFKTDMIRWGVMPVHFKRIVRFWDKAATSENKNRHAAYTVGVKMGLSTFNDIWVMNIVRVRLDSAQRERLIKRTAIRDGRMVEIGLEQEPGSGGKDSSLATVKRLLGFRVHVIRASGTKELRADEFSVAVNEGLVFLPERLRQGDDWIGWAKEYIEELKYWPHSAYLDQGDACLIAGTLVKTLRGYIPIESVCVGDMILTRFGYFPVSWSGITGLSQDLVKADFSNGSSLIGTYAHPVLTQEGGFVKLGLLKFGSIFMVSNPERGIESWQKGRSTNPMSWFTKEECTNGRGTIIGEEGIRFIETSGRTISETYLESVTYITKMKTPSTIIQAISNVLPYRNIEENTFDHLEAQKCLQILPEFVSRRRNGTSQRKVGNGTKNMVGIPGIIENTELTSAFNVEESLLRDIVEKSCSVPIFAMTDIEVRNGNCDLRTSVNSVERHSVLLRRKLDAVLINVPHGCDGKGVPVYNLKIEGPPEFFANGILVHNSGGAFNILARGKTRVGSLKKKRLDAVEVVG